MSKTARLSIGLVATAAFIGGLLVASGFNLTPFGYAQQSSSASRPPASTVQSLTETSNAFVSIAEHLTPAVVSIQTRQDARRGTPQRRGQVPPGMEEFFDQLDPNRQRQQPSEGSGSGFIVTPDGYIMTNNHVVAGADRVTVALQDRRVFSAKVIGRDPLTDVAVIKIEASGLPAVTLGNDLNTRVGEWVLAIGNPLALDFTVTAGIVSALNRGGGSLRQLYGGNPSAIVDYIQTDAAINPGNSGGPLVNARGEVIGINSAIASPTGTYAGYGFAIPITLAKDVMDDLVKTGRVERAILGVLINDVTPEDAQSAGLKEIRGVIVNGFNPTEGSPAKRAGIQAGDVIVSVAGREVDRVSTLQRFVRSLQPGQSVQVVTMRFGTRMTFQVKLGEAQAEEQVASAERNDGAPEKSQTYDKIGIAVAPLTAEQVRRAEISEAERGVVITDVNVNGPSYQRLFPGLVVIEVLYPERRRVTTAAELEALLSKVKTGQVVTLLVYNMQDRSADKATRVVSVRVGS
ncbi:MAG: Do family serine endopeptidase [Anaerolineae bacterium]|nr:Do family serine endopeptidase [Gemmatimonadaceae bacterium]